MSWSYPQIQITTIGLITMWFHLSVAKIISAVINSVQSSRYNSDCMHVAGLPLRQDALCAHLWGSIVNSSQGSDYSLIEWVITSNKASWSWTDLRLDPLRCDLCHCVIVTRHEWSNINGTWLIELYTRWFNTLIDGRWVIIDKLCIDLFVVQVYN